MAKPVFTITPDLVNALFLEFLKDLFVALIIVGVSYSGYLVLKVLKVITLTFDQILGWFILGSVLIIMFPLLLKVFVLLNTRFYFHHDRVESEFKFIIIKSQSALYSQIVNVRVEVSVWDRICNAGNIVLCTADDREPNVILRYIKDPKKVEHMIYKLIMSAKSAQSHRHHHQQHTH